MPSICPSQDVFCHNIQDQLLSATQCTVTIFRELYSIIVKVLYRCFLTKQMQKYVNAMLYAILGGWRLL